ncbi:unnamed protein product [Spirodela intermedia]|uniref:Uncharacterized protein n=2 Tax=Spirodela intermedia TaxID=51605 RepID=A0A7I8J041_SPIIN|nr:unnamed protein product [Spirodela intermedia]CAA6662670.1 unnamed protein product [Spirodela intermedia]CAA7399080.1 unnamed protein product [Spirodela intermedia]
MGLEEEEAEDQATEEEDGDAVEGELLAPQAAVCRSSRPDRRRHLRRGRNKQTTS